MNDVIRLLPDSVANQIAAGEVIQQPSSVVKELVENAVDAGAKHIQIILRDAGRTLIQVVDDGCGMSETDARLAFERHATSKINQATDLFALRTMGFRGEALASIAAIAQVELRTRRADDEVGTRIEITASKVTAQEPVACTRGSNMAIKNLFFNVPARRRFLKKDSVEFSNVTREFERLALVNPGIELTLIHNDMTVMRLSPTTPLQRICDLFGKGLSSQLIPVSTDTSIVKISGYIGRPENARRKGALQYLTVNGRNMRHPLFHKALMDCYEQLIAHDAKPNFFIDFQVEPETIDVNIHPTKNEIKFENEMAIRQILVAAVRESMGKYNIVPLLDFEQTGVPDIPAFDPGASASERPAQDIDVDYNPFAGRDAGQAAHRQPLSAGWQNQGVRSQNRAPADWDKLYADFASGAASRSGYAPSRLNGEDNIDTLLDNGSNNGSGDTIGTTLPSQHTLAGLESQAPDTPVAFQVRNRYIVTPCREGLMVVDQYRAHVNVLYHLYMESLDLGAMSAQTLLFPERVDVTATQTVLLDSIIDDVRRLGFDLAYLGDNTWSINAIPAVLGNCNPAETLGRLIEEIEETDTPGEEGLRRGMALSLARSAAIRPGQHLTTPEIEHLLSSLFKLPTPALSPSGRKVLSIITHDQLASLL